MKPKTLFIFNPEHDFALAVGNKTYTIPAEIEKIKRNNALLPALYAGNSDFILVPDAIPESDIGTLPYYSEVKNKNLFITYPRHLPNIVNEISFIQPWGWDHAIRKFLLEHGTNENLLPSVDYLNNLRALSHRRTTLPFRKYICNQLNVPLIYPGKELFNLSEIEEFLRINPVAYFKAPWSSSGRGIVVSDHISRKGLLEWAHGIIRRQGSVIGEPSWTRVLDFATEWEICGAEPNFKGYSVFSTSSRGKYHGNLEASQNELLKIITTKASGFNDKIINAQYYALKEFISPYYNGPLGIDMLVDSRGNINYCVEINLRLTMGYILLKNR